MSKVLLKNTSNANVIISAQDLKFRRELIPSRTITIEKEEYTELAFDPGFQALIDGGFITVVSGLEENETPAVAVTTTTKEEVRKIYQDKNYQEFIKLVKNASVSAKEIITSVAVEDKVTDNGFIQLIKQYCDNFDVIGAINFQHQATE